MPNHVANTLEIRDKKTAKKVFEAVLSTSKKRRFFDFDKVIPMPKDLNIDCDGLVMLLENSYMKHDTIERLMEQIDRAEEKAVENFCKAIMNKKRYGCASWYEWGVENWGTKWNSYDYERKSPTKIYFETAWSIPMPVLLALSAKFPEVEFIHHFADEDFGRNLGTGVFKGGQYIADEMSLSDHEKEEFAMRLHGYTDNDIEERRKELDETAS